MHLTSDNFACYFQGRLEGEVDGFICATGTGGTLAGTGKYLKEKSGGKTQVWLADPPGSVLYSYVRSGGKLTERSGGSITEGMDFFWQCDSTLPEHLI